MYLDKSLKELLPCNLSKLPQNYFTSYFWEKFDVVVSSVAASEIHWLQPPLSYIPVYPQKYDTTNTEDIISKSKGWCDQILPEVRMNSEIFPTN